MSNKEETDISDEEFEKLEEQMEEFVWKIDLEIKLKHSAKDITNLAKREDPTSVRQRKIYYFEIFPDYLWKRVGRTIIDHDIKEMLRINVECVKNEQSRQPKPNI